MRSLELVAACPLEGLVRRVDLNYLQSTCLDHIGGAIFSPVLYSTMNSPNGLRVAEITRVLIVSQLKGV